MKISGSIVIRVILFVFLPLLAGCSSDVWRSDRNITILYTSDTHSQFLSKHLLGLNVHSSSMANICTIVRKVREEVPGQVILLDDGDLNEGSPLSYYYNYVDVRKEHISSRVMNYLGYDALTVGNHDLEGGEAVYYDHLRRYYQMPWMAANAIDTRGDSCMFDPYCIIERNGVRVAVLGLVTPHTAHWLSRLDIPHLRFTTLVEAAQKWVPYIEQHEHPDLLVGMIHEGLDEAIRFDAQGNAIHDGVIPMLDSVRGFDIILLGHDHKTNNKVVCTRFGDSIPVIQPAPLCKELSRLDITVHPQRKDNGHRAMEVNVRMLDVAQYEPDSAYIDHFSDEVDFINAFLDRPISQDTLDFDGSESIVGPSYLMSLVHSVQLEYTKAQISMVSCIAGLSHRDEHSVTMRDLFHIYRYNNQMTKMWMNGSDVKRFLEYGCARQFNQMKSASDHLLAFRLKANGDTIMGKYGPELLTPQYNYTTAGGICYEVDVRKPAGCRVNILSMADGQPFDMQKRYDVVMSSYQASGGGGFLREGLGWDDDEIAHHTIRSTRKDLRYYIVSHLRKTKEGNPAMQSGWWRVIPQSWWKNAKERDLKMLLPYIRG